MKNNFYLIIFELSLLTFSFSFSFNSINSSTTQYKILIPFDHTRLKISYAWHRFLLHTATFLQDTVRSNLLVRWFSRISTNIYQIPSTYPSSFAQILTAT